MVGYKINTNIKQNYIVILIKINRKSIHKFMINNKLFGAALIFYYQVKARPSIVQPNRAYQNVPLKLGQEWPFAAR